MHPTILPTEPRQAVHISTEPAAAEAPVLLVAHGSRHPDAAGAGTQLRIRLADRLDRPVHLGHIEIASPSAVEVVDELADRGTTDLTVQPLLLLPGNHAKFDVGMVVTHAKERGLSVHLGKPLGSDVRLLDAAVARAKEALPADALLIIASGTASDAALRSLDTSAALVAAALDGMTVAAAPATLDGKGAGEVLERLRDEGATSFAVLPWMLLPGRLEGETVAALEAKATDLGLTLRVAQRLGDDPGVVEAIVRRIEAARPA